MNGDEISWLALAVWALTSTQWVYRYSESPHLMDNLGGLLATSQEIVGSFLVLGVLVLALLAGAVTRIPEEASERLKMVGQLATRRQARLPERTKPAIMLLIVLQVVINWLFVEMVWWSFALSACGILSTS